MIKSSTQVNTAHVGTESQGRDERAPVTQVDIPSAGRIDRVPSS